MGYSFQVVPIQKLKRIEGDLGRLVDPIDRFQALRLGACCLLATDLSEQCLNGIASEKRCLNTWARNQRSMVRFVRYKGSSRMRGAMNADISNAVDSARNTLEWLRDYAPYVIETSSTRMQSCLKYASTKEIEEYKLTFQQEIESTHRAEDSKSWMRGSIAIGAILLFIWTPAGIILLLTGLAIYLTNKNHWERIRKVESSRKLQLASASEQQRVIEQFDRELKNEEVIEDSSLRSTTISSIATDLKNKYIHLDVACRDLGSDCLNWEKLADEVYQDIETKKEEKPEGYAINNEPTTSIEISEDVSPAPNKLITKTTTNGSNEIEAFAKNLISKDIDDYYFKVNLKIARQIMTGLGYKRLPKEWYSISIKAEERICKYLATQACIEFDDYYWNFDEGNIKAEEL